MRSISQKMRSVSQSRKNSAKQILNRSEDDSFTSLNNLPKTGDLDKIADKQTKVQFSMNSSKMSFKDIQTPLPTKNKNIFDAVLDDTDNF